MAAPAAVASPVQHGHIDDSVVPGTVHIVDLDHTMSTKHSKGNSEIVLVPTPSDDPDDPVSHLVEEVFNSEERRLVHHSTTSPLNQGSLCYNHERHDH